MSLILLLKGWLLHPKHSMCTSVTGVGIGTRLEGRDGLPNQNDDFRCLDTFCGTGIFLQHQFSAFD